MVEMPARFEVHGVIDGSIFRTVSPFSH
jgi:hypothetical protein